MFYDIAALWVHHVEAGVHGYLAQRSVREAGTNQDLRTAVVAAEALYHFREHLPDEWNLSWGDVVAACPGYLLLRDVVNAAKHGTLGRGNPAIHAATQITERAVITEYRDDVGEYSHVEKEVVVRLNDGGERELADLIVEVGNYWLQQLELRGIVDNRPRFELARVLEPRTRADASGNRLDLRLIQGLGFKQTFALRRFDYTTGQVRPVDLTGASASFTIRRPPKHHIDVELTNNATGQKFTRTIELTDEENSELHFLEDPGERQAFARRILAQSLRKHPLVDEPRSDIPLVAEPDVEVPDATSS